jgi:L,D-transpeptidase ErfK/SrfK
LKSIKPVRPIVVCAFLASGCAVLEDYDESHSQRPGSDVATGQRPLAEPISRNYFVLEADDQGVIGDLQIVLSREEDTFSDLAREYGLGYDEIVDANPGIDPWLPGENTPILLPTQYVLPDAPRDGIVLNIASKRLFYFPQSTEGHSQSVLTFPIGIGRVGWETPLGDAAVIAKARDPHWYVPASVRAEHEQAGDPLPAVVAPGPDNPLGRHVLKLDLPGYLIHGTNQPYGVGMRVSHGCVRLYPENIELLYSLVETGEAVTIVNQPYLSGWRDGELYFESHKQLEDDQTSAEEHLQHVFISMGPDVFGNKREQDQARSASSEALGVPVRVLRGDVAEIYERARYVRNTVEHDDRSPVLAETGDETATPSESPGQASTNEGADESPASE